VQQESAACRAVANDVDFTSLCADIAAFFGHAIILLRMADTDLPNASKMAPSSYMCKSKMEEFRKKLPFAAVCIDKDEKREQDLLLHPIHFAAYLVDPEYFGHKQLTTPQCMEGFLTFVLLPACICTGLWAYLRLRCSALYALCSVLCALYILYIYCREAL
jgi:hypothetical protein